MITVFEEGARAAPESDAYRAGQELSARRAAERALEELGGERRPETDIETWIGDPVDVLVRLSEHIDLLICGSRGYGPMRAVLLGAVSHRLVTKARCPLAVVPRGRGSRLESLIGESQAAANA